MRRLAALLPLLALLLLGQAVTSPAQAAATDPVTNLQVTQAQTAGVHNSWSISATWDDNGAPSYTASIVANADGSGTPYAGPQDVVGTNAVTLAATGLAAGNTYYVAVYPTAAGSSAVVTTAFVASTLDTTAPTGTFTVAPTTAWLTMDLFSGTESSTASVTLTQTALSDNTSASSAITRRVLAGDGTAAQPWASGNTFKLTYTKAGTFTPQVELTDGFGNTGTISLSPVTVGNDVTGPTLKIAIPAHSNLISSWRVVRGTSTDDGTGVVLTAAVVAQKRGGVWYAYDFHKRTWVKGYASLRRTLGKKARPAFMTPTSTGAWHTPKIRGLRGGPLHVEAIAIDESFNLSLVKVDRKIH